MGRCQWMAVSSGRALEKNLRIGPAAPPAVKKIFLHEAIISQFLGPRRRPAHRWKALNQTGKTESTVPQPHRIYSTMPPERPQPSQQYGSQEGCHTLSVDLQEPAYKNPRLALWSEIKNA